jgi:membrane protease YdiL (CAAX protease family)
LIAGAARRPAVRAAALALYIVAVEWARALAMRAPELTSVALVLGGGALVLAAWGFTPAQLGLGTSRAAYRVLGGLALGAVLLLPGAVREGGPLLPAGLALAAVVVSVGEEIAFRGALYAALEEAGGAPLAIVGGTLLWTAAHAFSHPPAFLGAVAAAGLLLALWRWACRDLVGPVIAHVIADLAL